MCTVCVWVLTVWWFVCIVYGNNHCIVFDCKMYFRYSVTIQHSNTCMYIVCNGQLFRLTCFSDISFARTFEDDSTWIAVSSSNMLPSLLLSTSRILSSISFSCLMRGQIKQNTCKCQSLLLMQSWLDYMYNVHVQCTCTCTCMCNSVQVHVWEEKLNKYM